MQKKMSRASARDGRCCSYVFTP